MNSLFMTDRGQIRTHNEDAGGTFLNGNGQLLAVIADGMGGHNAGDIASDLTIKSLSKKWKDAEEITLESPSDYEQWLHNVIIDINRIIYRKSQMKKELSGMGTTVVASICTDSFITLAHIGDSRCYLSNKDGFSQVTEDHSLVNELVRIGEITAEDADSHPRKNVLLKALGTEAYVKPDVRTINWEEGDRLLICSDGLSNKVTEKELKEFLESKRDLQATGEELINLANQRGGEDNISLILIHYESLSEAGESTC